MIPSSFYDQIVKSMPIASVEAIIVKNDSFLMLKRKNDPAKGLWWFPGGRIMKGEMLEDTLKRKIKEETGLDVIVTRLVNVYSRIFPERHDITIVFLCKIAQGDIVLNEEHSEYKFISNIPENLHPYILQAIRDSEIR